LAQIYHHHRWFLESKSKIVKLCAADKWQEGTEQKRLIDFIKDKKNKMYLYVAFMVAKWEHQHPLFKAEVN